MIIKKAKNNTLYKITIDILVFNFEKNIQTQIIKLHKFFFILSFLVFHLCNFQLICD